MARLRAFYPNFYGDDLIAYVSLRIIRYCNSDHLSADIMGLSSDKSVRGFKLRRSLAEPDGGATPAARRIYRDAIPPGALWALSRRLWDTRQLRAFAEGRFLSGLHRGDLAYLWPSSSLRLYRRCREAGCLVVSETINTLLFNSKRILDEEFAALGLPLSHGLTESAAEEERACMELSDYIFSPSPGVTESILAAGIAPSKILQSSYGLEASEILPPKGPRSVNRPVTAIFVGTICVRKGIHLLFEAWKKAGARARLLVVGRVSPEAEAILERALKANPDIEHIDFVDDLRPIYRDADFLILPSLEEGSPLVSYLALGAGLPLLVSPMGAGGIVEDGKDGLIVDPHDADGLAEAIRRLVADSGLRARMAEAAYAKAPYYTWEKVAARRRELLLSKAGPGRRA